MVLVMQVRGSKVAASAPFWSPGCVRPSLEPLQKLDAVLRARPRLEDMLADVGDTT